MFERFINLLSRKKKQQYFVDIKEIDLGTNVRIYFKDPRKIGIINNDVILRYDPDDIEKKYITGTLTNRKHIRDMIFIEVGTFKFFNGQRKERLYTLMNDEIEKVEIL